MENGIGYDKRKGERMGSKAVKNMPRVALFSALMAVFSWIAIPSPIPFTLQLLILYLEIFAIGAPMTIASTLVYVLLGVIGLPVFAGFGGGIGYLVGATGGFILALPVSALCYHILEKAFGRGKQSLIFAFISLFVIYLIGSIWFAYVYSAGNGFAGTLTLTVIPYIIPDTIKIVLAYYLGKRLSRIIKQGKV